MSTMKVLMVVVIIGLLGAAVWYLFSVTQGPEDIDNTPPISTDSDHTALLRNCAMSLPVGRVDDMSFDPERKTVHVYWTEGGENFDRVLPYEPENNFAGCSTSSKEVLQRVKDTQL